ncbi:MAG: hypothetical protein GY854_02195 [Deltaproteobacteria bacterium]|nr:hypothetical protein [Deltaproteobacteria bacterium]
MSERKFEIFERGHIRDKVVLTDFRNRLRMRNNPATNQPFTEDEIQRATQPGTYFHIQADAIDLLSQAMQAKSLLLARQQRPTHANTRFLEEVHAALWLGPNARLPATGGSGTVDAPAVENTIFVGSMNIGDPAAAVATDPNGYRYQVLETVTTPPTGVARLTMKAIDTGEDTNPENGTIFTWAANKPLGAEPEATIQVDALPHAFTGGYAIESDAELAVRVEEVIRHRPAAGNPAHFVAWAKESSVAVESAFVYPCAFHAGSVLVCVTQKRGTTQGPYGRTNVSIGTLADATSYLVPPNSPVVPQRAYVVVTKPSPQDADIVLRVAMGRGIAGGWVDVDPWPNPESLTTSYPAVEISSVTSQTEFDVTTDFELPGGATILLGSSAPQLMVWDQTKSRFVQLSVASVANVDPTTYTVTLSQAADITIETGQRISPYTDHMDTLAEATEAYFDELGPGEAIDLDIDERAHRAFRYPPVNERYPSRAGQAIISRLMDALGEAASDASLEEISRNEPDLPGDLIDGPNIVTLGNVAVYPL